MRVLRLLVVLTVPLFGAAPASAALEKFPLPSSAFVGGGLGMHGLTVAPDGTVWFGAQVNSYGDSTPMIGRFDSATGQISTYRTPENPLGAGLAGVSSLAWDPTSGGRLWFARNDGVYGYAVPSALNSASIGAGMSIATTTTSGRIGVEGLAVDQTSGTVWLVERGSSNAQMPAMGANYYPGNRLAKTGGGLGLTDLPNLAQQGGETSLVDLRYSADPTGVSLDAAGNAWFGESNPGNPGWRIGRATGGSYTEWSLPCISAAPCSGSYTAIDGVGGPDSTAVASDGSVWFTIPMRSQIGRLDPNAGTMTTYRLADMGATIANGKPRGIRSAADGSLWFASYGGFSANKGANALVKITPAGTAASATVFSTGTDAAPLAVAPAPNGDVYATLTASVAPTYLGRLSAGSGPAPTPTPGPSDTPAPNATPGPNTTPAPSPAPTPTPVALRGTTGTAQLSKWEVKPDGIYARQLCVGPPADKCSLIFLLDTNEYVRGFPGSRNALAATAPKTTSKAKKKRTVLGQLSVTLSGGQSKTVAVKLSAKAKKALKKQKRIKARLTVTQKQPDGTTKVLTTRNVTLKG